MEEKYTFQDLLERNGCIAYTNKGISMMPLLREDRDVMLIKKRGSERCRKLDAVLFKRSGITGRGEYVLHRILKVNSDGTYWIVGDNCTSGEIVGENSVIGVLTAIKRGNKTISVNNIFYRLYINTWCRWYHLRFFILRMINFLKNSIRKIKHAIQYFFCK